MGWLAHRYGGVGRNPTGSIARAARRRRRRPSDLVAAPDCREKAEVLERGGTQRRVGDRDDGRAAALPARLRLAGVADIDVEAGVAAAVEVQRDLAGRDR